MAWTTVASAMSDDDEVRVLHNVARRTEYGTDLPEAVHVMFGDVDVFGTPERIAVVLDEALTRVQSIMDARREESDR